MKVSKALVTLCLFVGSASFANPPATNNKMSNKAATKTATEVPNCEVEGTKMKVADKNTCEEQHGTWLLKEEAAAPAAAPAKNTATQKAAPHGTHKAPATRH